MNARLNVWAKMVILGIKQIGKYIFTLSPPPESKLIQVNASSYFIYVNSVLSLRGGGGGGWYPTAKNVRSRHSQTLVFRFLCVLLKISFSSIML